MHEWEMKKAQVREQVKKWAAYAAAKRVNENEAILS